MNKKIKWLLGLTGCILLCGGVYFFSKSQDVVQNSPEIMVLAEDTPLDVEDGIVSHTLALTDTIYLGYYTHDSVAESSGEKVEVYVWDNIEDAENCANNYYKCDFYQDIVSESGTNYKLHLLKGFGYKNLVDVFYAREVRYFEGDTKTYSDIDEYSMIDYCFNHQRDSSYLEGTSRYTLGEFVKDIVSYATGCQKYFNYRTDYLAIDNYFFPRGRFASYGKDKYFASFNDFKEYIEDSTNQEDSLSVNFYAPFTYDGSLSINADIRIMYLHFVYGTKINGTLTVSDYSGEQADYLQISNVTINRGVTLGLRKVHFVSCVFEDCVSTILHSDDYISQADFDMCEFNSTSYYCLRLNRIEKLLFDSCTFSRKDSQSSKIDLTDIVSVTFKNGHYGSIVIGFSFFKYLERTTFMAPLNEFAGADFELSDIQKRVDTVTL